MKFIERLKKEMNKGRYLVIPDIKCFSPKEGDLLQGRNPVDVAISLVNAGAPVLSVVTEQKEFKGSMELLKSIAKTTNVPILRKDFIYTKEDLLQTKKSGASAILLMCSCLSKEEMRFLYHEALELGLDPFVETHTKEELEFAAELGAKLVGINNRNILELERDNGTVSRTCDLAAYAPKDALIVSESSIQSPEEVKRAIRSGADMVLVGTAILQARNTELFYKMLCSLTSMKICGLKSKEDVEVCIQNNVQILGFVTEYPVLVPWNLQREETKKLMELVPPPYKTCIVTGGKPEEIITLAKELRPDMVQIHYHETLTDTKIIADELYKEGIETIKTVPLSEEERLLQFGTTDIEKIVLALCETKVAALLVDAREPSKLLETGEKVDREIFRIIKQKSNKSVILAGGITVDNINDVLDKMSPEYIDIMTGVEKSPGKKDSDKIAYIMLSVINSNFQKGE